MVWSLSAYALTATFILGTKLFPVYTTMTDGLWKQFQECCGAPLPGPHPIAGDVVLFAYTVW